MTLTDTHLVLLSAAARHQDRLLPRPDHIRGRAADALATKLVRVGLVEEVTVRSGQPHWREDDSTLFGLRITPEGLAAIGVDEGDRSGTQKATAAMQALRAPRPGSKQAVILDLLQRDQGASLDELIAATGWLPHTTRAALTGLRQRGYGLTRSKAADGRTVYRILSEPAQASFGEEA